MSIEKHNVMNYESVCFEGLTLIAEKDPQNAIDAVVAKLESSLQKGKVLWLLCGGSNVPGIVSALATLKARATPEELCNLMIGLTDERYGEVNHENSNWRQLCDAGLDIRDIEILPLLTGKSIEDTTRDYAHTIETLYDEGVTIIAQLGIANDGHLAGVLPGTEGVHDSHTACSYVEPNYERITLTLQGLKKIATSFSFMYGEAKAPVVSRFSDTTIPYEEMPAQILREMPEAFIYTDQPLPKSPV